MGTENKGFEQLFVDILQTIKKRPVPEISVEQQINTPTPPPLFHRNKGKLSKCILHYLIFLANWR